MLFLVREKPLIESLKYLPVPCLIFAHLMNSIMNGIVVKLLCLSRDTLFIRTGSGLSFHSLFKISLGIPYNLSYEFGKFGGMFSLLKCYSLESLSDFRIAFTIGLTAHSYIHTHFGTFSRKMGL